MRALGSVGHFWMELQRVQLYGFISHATANGALSLLAMHGQAAVALPGRRGSSITSNRPCPSAR